MSVLRNVLVSSFHEIRGDPLEKEISNRSYRYAATSTPGCFFPSDWAGSLPPSPCVKVRSPGNEDEIRCLETIYMVGFFSVWERETEKSHLAQFQESEKIFPKKIGYMFCSNKEKKIKHCFVL